VTASDGPSLQERYAPASICFGCGPANAPGLHIRSFESDGELIATWSARPEHQAFPGVLNGGIVGCLLDCHANWAAAIALMHARAADRPPATVTADYSVRLLRPTPTADPITLHAGVDALEGDRAVVAATIEAGGRITATFRGTFVAVEPGHPAYHRWD
jgi:acyl-coenzyme A thioesterase PaaI-like protein